ncbi:MAG: magnesium transporter CorA family protein [Planctomycetia bacterium]|nr:magnesium transporter CorA family protein [Planctomycetia bacterium]
MITAYTFESGRLVDAELQDAPVLFCCEPDQSEKLYIQKQFNLGWHSLNSILDENELPRVEHRNDKIIIIMKHPLHIGVVDAHIEFRVTSLGAVIHDDQLLFIFNEEMSEEEFLRLYSSIHNIRDLLINILHRTTMHFHEHLRCISLGIDQLEDQLGSRDVLVNMFTLGKSMTYYVNALNGNHTLIDRIYNIAGRLGFDSQQQEILDDIRLDSAQCCQEAQITMSIITRMMDARISLMGNDLNVLMKRLTIFSLLLMPMNVIAGIGGMSEYTLFMDKMFGENVVPMWVSYPIMFIIFGILAYITYLVLKRFNLV